MQAEDHTTRDLADLLAKSREASWHNFGKRIRFYAPSFLRYENRFYNAPSLAFSSISITGNTCGLGCKHCQGQVLETMIPAQTPLELLATCKELYTKGCRGVLISGGCLQNGSIPFEPFIETISRIKREMGFTIIIHTGIIKIGIAKKLAQAGVDAALIDVIGSDKTIKDIYRLNITTKDYEDSLEALEESGMAVIPHVVVGLQYGRLLGESEALDMISRHRPNGVVVIALIPIKGTPMENSPVPEPTDIAFILAEAKLKMPKIPVALGCMRPTGKHRVLTDVMAVDAGVNGIAFPAEEAIHHAEKLGLNVSFSPFCCSQIFEDLRIPRAEDIFEAQREGEIFCASNSY